MSDKKVAVITGGSRGIGRAIAYKYASCGYDVAITGRDYNDEAKEAIEEMKALGVMAKFYEGDVSHEESVILIADAIISEYGRVDVLVNNAGITKDNLFMRQSTEDMQAVIAVNLFGTMLMTKAFLKTMMKQRGGHIINMSSIVGIEGNKGQADYAASKAGIIGFTKTIAKEYGKWNICVNAIAPGFIETAMTKQMTDEAKAVVSSKIALGRCGKPSEVAELAYFLGSEANTYITGETIRIDGGLM